MDEITFGSLFAGIGGFDLGFERAGMVCKWQVDIDDYANKVLAKHWPAVHRERDIRECGPHNLQRVDVICGGFPCQDISYAGHGAGLDGERSGLFFEAVRVVRQLRPRVVVLENVAALLTRGLDRVLGTLAEIGYDAEWHCLPASMFGAPHSRDRVFVIAYTKCNGCDLDVGFSRVQTIRTHANGLSHIWNSSVGSETWQQFELDNSRVAPEKWTPTGRQSDSRPLLLRNDDGVPARVDRLRGLGNAVVPQVAEWIGRRVVKALRSQEGSSDDA